MSVERVYWWTCTGKGEVAWTSKCELPRGWHWTQDGMGPVEHWCSECWARRAKP